MKRHTSQIFMGNDAESTAECYALVSALMQSFSNLSALQQLQAPESDWDRQQIEDMEYFIHDTAQNIYTALTGEKFNRKGELMK
jgi:hypothetical protein